MLDSYRLIIQSDSTEVWSEMIIYSDHLPIAGQDFVLLHINKYDQVTKSILPQVESVNRINSTTWEVETEKYLYRLIKILK